MRYTYVAMDSLLSTDFFIHNRAALRESVTQFPIVIAGNGLLQRTSDTTFPFAQESTFWYLTGLQIPDLVLVIDRDETYLIVPGRSAIRAAFDGAVSPTEITKRSGIETILAEKEGWKKLKSSLFASHLVSTLETPQKYISAHGFYTNPARQQLGERLLQIDPDLEIWTVDKEVAALRVIKQPEEIACIEQAVSITKNAINRITNDESFQTIHFEYELEALLGAEFRRLGASGHAYSPIVASGMHATTLHYISNDGPIDPKDYIVVDVGAEVEHYAADITRTIIQGKPSARQRAVHIAVQAVQREALTLMKPGATLQHIERHVELFIGKELKSLGLITNSRDTDAIRHYYPHAVSHFLGLDVHDVGNYHAALRPGMVLTCEPGIYIPEEGIGVRIEDDVLITESGNRIL
jgi:Xaa-Pro aminopeptidase